MKVRCPSCKSFCSWEGNPHRPFCSEACRDHDLGNWATERYRVPVQEEPDADRAIEQEKKKKTDEEN